MTRFLLLFDSLLGAALLILAIALFAAGLRDNKSHAGGGGSLIALAVFLVIVAARLVAP